eukprot:862018_1
MLHELIMTITRCLGLIFGYTLRPIHSDRKDLNVNDTRGPPRIDTEWSYKSRTRNPSTDTMELSCVSVRPLSNNTRTILPKQNNFDVLIIGGAAAGLSVAACCQKEGLSYLVLEKNEHVSDIWLSRYHRLHLHDIIDNCHLPFLDMPTTFPLFPSRREFAQYLEGYKTTLNLQVQTSSIVQSAQRSDQNDKDSEWILRVRHSQHNQIKSYQCKHLVMACGIYGDPNLIDINGSDTFTGLIVHSSRYTNATDLGLTNKRVLVVGWGNSGADIALDLVEHGAKPTLLIRSGQVCVPQRLMSALESLSHARITMALLTVPFGWMVLIPGAALVDIVLQLLCRIYYGDLSQYGVKVHSKGVFARLLGDGIPPLTDVGTIAAIKDGSIAVMNSEIEECNGDMIQFVNGNEEAFDAIVLATGYHMFSLHRHWLNENDLKLIGSGKKALGAHKLLLGGNFDALPTLWTCCGNLVMIKSASQRLVAAIKDRVNNENINSNGIWWIKHLIALAIAAFMIPITF